MKQLITGVRRDSIACEIGINAGDYLLTINGNDVVDIIDYEQLTCDENLLCVVERKDGEIVEFEIEKESYEPLGLDFESSLMSPVKQCKNHCIFCFIDQMHEGGRQTLHFKDDDWRLSLIMGNYVTLTNVDDEEFERIIKRRVSPLYISVHATDGEIRQKMMRNPSASMIMDRLKRLCDAELYFHCQVVLCPTINDGDVLVKTIENLYAMSPYAQSLAVVPVGLTKNRSRLFPLRRLTPLECIDTIRMIEKLQKRFLAERGSPFVYASDEMYTYAKLDLPPEESYEDYPQLENGVGLLRKFEYEFNSELEDRKTELKKLMKGKKITLHSATGIAAHRFLSNIFDKLSEFGIDLQLVPIKNNFFGDTVTVTGLTVATDIIDQMQGRGVKHLLIPHNMLRENDNVFLDGLRTTDVEKALDCTVHKMYCHDGSEFLIDLIDEIGKITDKGNY